VFEVPFVDALVPVVDLEKGRIEIVALPGLVDGTG
jgi:ribosomal 30S subunit maturation factor RimM